ncbi:MAG TPA: nuclear transport factor 2 family protein [Kutzneria sp.]|jgi:hypothetical protein|nr:nuclear transport factor 2 family protein [Kutzneria sp.]
MTTAASRDAVQEIRTVVENWAVWRDAGDWERFATVWHSSGQMWATWFQGTATDFITASREGFDAGVRILHFLGGTSVDVAGTRAIAQTKMTITQRSQVHGTAADVICTGRFYDFFTLEDGQWRIALRRLIYETDRLTPVDPAARIQLDQSQLARFPEGYRHLAYIQLEAGFDVKTGLPGLTGEAVQALYRDGAAWLAHTFTI